MRLIVGLGNPGPRYEATRHNVGWRVVDAFAARFRLNLDTHEKDAYTGQGRVAGNQVMLAKPLTFMNLSGEAVSKLVRAYTDGPGGLMVVYDDIDLPLGRLRVRERGSAGTHNGMRSIVSSLGSEAFARLRVGISGEGREQVRELADYVLQPFAQQEEDVLNDVVARSVDALLLFCRGDLRRAMNQLNRDPKEPGQTKEPVDAPSENSR